MCGLTGHSPDQAHAPAALGPHRRVWAHPLPHPIPSSRTSLPSAQPRSRQAVTGGHPSHLSPPSPPPAPSGHPGSPDQPVPMAHATYPYHLAPSTDRRRYRSYPRRRSATITSSILRHVPHSPPSLPLSSALHRPDNLGLSPRHATRQSLGPRPGAATAPAGPHIFQDSSNIATVMAVTSSPSHTSP